MGENSLEGLCRLREVWGPSTRAHALAQDDNVHTTYLEPFTCHPERSECFAQRSRNGVEGPLISLHDHQFLKEFSPGPFPSSGCFVRQQDEQAIQ